MPMPITLHARGSVLLCLFGALTACAHPAPALPESTDTAPTRITSIETKPVLATPVHTDPTTEQPDTARAAAAPSAPPDREQPIHIKADRIEINQKKSTTFYIGRVSLTQGGLRITAARAEASYQGDKINRIIATGKYVTLYQPSETPGQDLHASTLRLEYHALDNQVDLVGEVRLQQGTNVVLCNTLHYDLTENVLSAEGDGVDNRVSVTIESTTLGTPLAPRASPSPQKQGQP